jgi:hypothetical protein
MAFALTKFKAYGLRAEGAVRPHAQQVFSFTLTAANTDITYDLGTSGGTFWTSAVAHATYGSLATSVRTLLLTTLPGLLPDNALMGCDAEPLKTYIQVASGASGSQYTLAISASMPTITFVSASAPTAWVLNLRWNLIDGAEALVADYGTTNN